MNVIIIPYRNREAHLDYFLQHTVPLLNKHMKNIDSVFHLAALIGIPYSYLSPLAYIRTNVEGTYNVLESARNLDVEDILITSTSETYGTAQTVPINELHPLVGQSPYSASKIAADQLAISYNKSFNMPVKIVRPFNTYGPRQSARAIIPTIIIQEVTTAVPQIIQEAQITLVVQEAQALEVLPLDLHQVVEDK